MKRRHICSPGSPYGIPGLLRIHAPLGIRRRFVRPLTPRSATQPVSKSKRSCPCPSQSETKRKSHGRLPGGKEEHPNLSICPARLRRGVGGRPAQERGCREGRRAMDESCAWWLIKAGRGGGGNRGREKAPPNESSRPVLDVGGASEFAGRGKRMLRRGHGDVAIAHRTNPAAVRGPPLLLLLSPLFLPGGA